MSNKIKKEKENNMHIYKQFTIITTMANISITIIGASHYYIHY
jgi:hypothetical protein